MSLKLIGASTAFGSPLNVLSGMGSGVADFFYEPANGFLIGPEEFARGVCLCMCEWFCCELFIIFIPMKPNLLQASARAPRVSSRAQWADSSAARPKSPPLSRRASPLCPAKMSARCVWVGVFGCRWTCGSMCESLIGCVFYIDYPYLERSAEEGNRARIRNQSGTHVRREGYLWWPRWCGWASISLFIPFSPHSQFLLFFLGSLNQWRTLYLQ